MNSSDNLKKEYFLPKRIILENNTVNSSALFESRPRQCFWPDENDCFRLKAGGSVVIDFGKELQGGLLISVFIATNANLHIVFGESVSESMSQLGEKHSDNLHSARNYNIVANLMTTFETGNTGFRFVKISTDRDVVFNTIQAFCIMQDLEYKGSFQCDDELLNEIWKTGAYTMNLNMQEYIFDGIKRDRLVWIGDMHPEVNTILSVFGSTKCINNSLDMIALDLKNKKWMNNLPSYSMWWLIIQYDLFWHDGNWEYFRSKKDTVLKIINDIISEIQDDGSYDFGNGSYSFFVDWSSRKTPFEKAGFNAILMLALEHSVKLCDMFGENSVKKEVIKKYNAIKNHEFEFSGNKQITALKYLSGTLSEDEAFRILTKNGADGLSCFMGFYVLTALAKMKKTDDFLDIIRQFWGGQLKMGATTFWEDFDINWMENASRIDEIVPEGKTDIHGDNGKFCYSGFRHSLCHGWASGPTAILSKYILGVIPVEPGYKKIKIDPQLGSLKFAKGSIPTPYGIIKIEHTNNENKIQTKIDLPAGIEII